MSRTTARIRSLGRKLLAVAGVCVIIGTAPAQAAEPVSESAIVRALTAKGALTRNLSGARDSRRDNLIRTLRSRPRSLSYEERTEIATIAKQRPSIDLEIYFDFNSSEISAKAVPDLMTLGRALTSAALDGGVYLLSGHTDAKGSQDYNQPLSERRAQSVKAFLMQNFQIPDDRLVAAGYGKEQLKNSANPFAAENRRVQVTNLQSKQEASQ